jgi:putative two-component system response regulator/two-component system response regulator RpfG
LHDVGKIGIPDSILLKPGPLTEEQFNTMKTHTEIGFNILKNTRSKYLQAGGVIAWTHHEKIDGSGYPRGIRGNEIPLLGRIVAVADVFDALISDRVYKKSWSPEEAIEFMKLQSGTHFDPELIEYFVFNKDEFIEISKKRADTDFSQVI